MLNPIKKILLLGLSLISLSCVKEDYSQCDSALSLMFKYELNTKSWESGRPVDLFDQSIGYISVLFFDSDGLFFDEYDDTGFFGDKSYKFQMRLPEGEYTAIVWGGEDAQWNYTYCHMLNADKNVYEKKLIKGVTRLQDFRLMLNEKGVYDGEYLVIDKPANLFYGKADLVSMGKEPWQYHEYTVNLMKNTHKIEVAIKKMDGAGVVAKQVVPYEVYCLARNTRYDFDNSIGLDAPSVKYTALPDVKNESHFEYEFNMLRMLKDEKIKLVVNEGDIDKSFMSLDLIKAILEHPKYNTQEDLDREDQFVFEINIYPNMYIEVFINGWKSYDIDIEI
ncbi:MAG: FimB/Mfa2 family fimbrial subunit [Bacteroidales bacterium]